MNEEGRTEKKGYTDHTWSCQLRSTCEGDTTGSSYGGSCLWCTGWLQGKCNHFVLLKQEKKDEVRDKTENMTKDVKNQIEIEFESYC